jgi:threonine dehydrogenase-like Zn-dependent dehydrogenase
MRALVVNSGGCHFASAVPEPQLQDNQALLKIRRAGICNTDLEVIAGYMNFSGILGHEFVAEVTQGPDELIGRRVVGEISVADGTCDLCQRGLAKHCRTRVTVGINQHDGCFADYLALDARNLHPVPDNISDDEAVFVEPLAAAIEILDSVHISPRATVLVLGLGKLGMLVSQVLRLTGAHIIGIVRRESQARLLAKWGIPSASRDELPSRHAQVVVDCTGRAEGFADALELVEPRGTIVLKSTYKDIPLASLTRIAVNEVRVVGSRCGPFDAALRLLAAGLVDVESLIEARYPFDAVLQALDHAAQPGVLKVLLDFP